MAALPTAVPKPSIDQLRYVVQNFPAIDNHAHNLLLESKLDTHPFESITSEAQGRALRDTFKSLPHLRAVRQLRDLYECHDEADWEEILQQRIEWLHSDPERLNQRCFHNTFSILMDDGLAGPDKVHPYHWHNRYTKAPTKRIVRIETVAERLMERTLADATDEDLDDESYLTDTWVTFTEEFEREIQEYIQDTEVAGFKTVICYRSGLDIEPDYEVAAQDVAIPFERYVQRCIRKRKYRIERKALNDYLVLRTLEILSERVPPKDALSKPLQFHTGLGDNDISLLQSNPAYLQPLIENYTSVPFVLLHSAYPYEREAGYLATVYKHVYLDVGEVFPMVSRDGQTAILRHSLELVPGNKLLYSSDGHFFPETYWLANIQFREVLLEILIDYVQRDDLTPYQAINLTKDLLFNNSNVLYDLRLQADFREMPEESPKPIAWHSRPVSRSGDQQPHPPIFPPPPAHIGSPFPATFPPSSVRSLSPRSRSVKPESPYQPPSFPPPSKKEQVYDVELFELFMVQYPDVKWVYVQWLDYMATIRLRILPIKEFRRLIREGDRIGISQGNTGTLQNDGITPVVNPVGQIYIEPDLRSLRRSHKKDPLPSATVFSYWRDESGRPLRECPRSNLETLISDLQIHHDTTLLVGFEIEVTLLRRNSIPNPTASSDLTQPLKPSHLVELPAPMDSTSPSKPSISIDRYTPLTDVHAWGTLAPQQWLQLPILAEIAVSLQEMAIEIQQFHAESGAGQYEFILPPLPPLAAVDTLIQARQTIAQIAALHDLRATLHPQPFPGIGTAAHAHISLNSESQDKDMAFFVGGVLAHLPAICAFAMPETVSYGRVVDDSWTGGTWVSWGTQNRETPLRRVKPGRWELRCLDGMANMYFALSAVIAAGLLGLQHHTAPSGEAELAQGFTAKDVPVNPSTLSAEQREAYGIVERLPRSFEEALGRLAVDTELKQVLTEGFVSDYVAMKRAEQQMLDNMGEQERRVWLIERY